GLVLLGCAVLILPALLISLSAEHLRGARWGTGYLPVYISYFGAALLILAALAPVMCLLSGAGVVRRVLSHAAALGLGGVCACVSMVDYRDNVFVVKQF